MKKIAILFGILLGCFAVGYGAGSLLGKMYKDKENGKGYIAASDIRVEDGVMTPEVLLAMGRLSDPRLSPDGSMILYGVSYTSVKQNRSCRNIFVCAADGTSRTQLTRCATSVSNARWSADGGSILFVRDGQIWKAPFRRGKKGSPRLGSLGKPVQISDIASGVGEFSISPDGGSLIYTSTVPGPVKTPKDSDPGLDKANAYTAEGLMYRHWDHWVTETPRTFVAALDNVTDEGSADLLGEEPYELPTEPFGGIEQLSWHPDSRHIAYSCRKKTGIEYAFSTDTDIYIYDIETGTSTLVSVNGNGTVNFGDGYDTDPVWSPDGGQLAWISMERNGYEADAQRLVVADVDFADGIAVSNVRQVAASLDRDASGIFWNDGKILFSALTDGVQAIFEADPSDGSCRRLTKEGWDYDFFSPFAVRDGKLLTSYYCLNFPVELVSVDPAEGTFRQISSENGHILSQLDEPTSRSVWIETVDHKQMQCWIMYPPKFDSTKVYPAIEIVLGGPQGTNSQDWSYRWCYRLMAQQGYVVILPNRRGTTAFGQEWKEQISGDYCGLNMQDYLTAGRYIKSMPYVGRLGCVGASYGGYSAYMLEGLHGDLYDCFIAHAGIFNEKQMWYTTEEMWFANWDNGGLTPYAYTEGETGPRGDGITFGGMQQAGAPYAVTPKSQRHYANDPSTMVTRWHTPILCIHGMMDYRIPYEQGMAAFNAAQMMGVPSKLVVFPEENHWILKPQNSLYWHREFYDWLDKWLK